MGHSMTPLGGTSVRARPARLAAVHWPLIGVMALIALLGIYNLHSAAAARDSDLYLTQLLAFAIGCLLILLAMVPDYRVSEGLAYPLYAITCLMLVAVLIQGKTAGGAQRWLELGSVSFQPSELAKIGTILCVARYFSHRVRPDGYSMRVLFRPLNPSRPLTAIAVLVVGWNKPWLVDPDGELARAVYKGMDGAVPVVSDLLWFRVLIMVLLAAGCAGGVWVIVRVERQRALLDPWPPGRRTRLIAMWVVLVAALGGGVATLWDVAMLRDPVGAVALHLVTGATAGGPYAVLKSSLTLRLVLIAAVILYSVASVWYVIRSRIEVVDLVIAPIDLVIIPALLVLVEPDLGTAGIIVLIGLAMILVAGVRLRTLIILGAMGAFVAIVGWFGILEDYQKRRILSFIDPEHDIRGAGWNAVQSMIAVGSGRWTGKGHMEGTQTQLSFLPEQHTDFAFSVWAEEQGFLGCLFLLGLYALLLLFALAIASSARDAYGALLSAGVASLILWQTIINVGMVIGMLPVVGMTLPLFSYGGSSLLTVMVGVGLLLNVHLRRRTH